MKPGDLFRYYGLLFMVVRVEGDTIYAENPRHQLAISVDHPKLEKVD